MDMNEMIKDPLRALPPAVLYTMSQGTSLQARMAKEVMEERGLIYPSDSEVVSIINNKIAIPALGTSLTPAMQQEYLAKYKKHIKAISPDQAFDLIAAEFQKAVKDEDIAFYESRTGNIITGEGYEEDIDPELLPYVQKTGGASGGNKNLLIYGAIAAAGLFLLFGNKKKGKGLSGTAKKRKTSARKTQRTRTTKKR